MELDTERKWTINDRPSAARFIGAKRAIFGSKFWYSVSALEEICHLVRGIISCSYLFTNLYVHISLENKYGSWLKVDIDNDILFCIKGSYPNVRCMKACNGNCAIALSVCDNAMIYTLKRYFLYREKSLKKLC